MTNTRTQRLNRKQGERHSCNGLIFPCCVLPNSLLTPYSVRFSYTHFPKHQTSFGRIQFLYFYYNIPLFKIKQKNSGQKYQNGLTVGITSIILFLCYKLFNTIVINLNLLLVYKKLRVKNRML